MKTRWILIVAVVLAASFFVWKHFFATPVVTVAAVAPKNIVTPHNPDEPPAWVAPGEISAASAAASGQLPRAIDEPMPRVSESSVPPVLLAKGQFRPAIEEDHDVSGWVKLYQMPDKSYLLRIETLWMQGKPPELDVALTRRSAPRTDADAQPNLPVGPLKETSGNMNYPMPAESMNEVHALVLLTRDKKQLYASVTLVPPLN
jgi:hypothetical protein